MELLVQAESKEIMSRGDAQKVGCVVCTGATEQNDCIECASRALVLTFSRTIDSSAQGKTEAAATRRVFAVGITGVREYSKRCLQSLQH